MAQFTGTSFKNYDDYMTPFYVWEDIDEYIPKDKVIWESFYGDGMSAEHLKKLGCKEVIHEKLDFFTSNKGEIVISNPPFSKKKEVLERLVELDKPFILLMPSSTLNTQYCRKLFKDKEDKLKIIIPKKRINFKKLVNGEIEKQKHNCNFDCFYYFWKIDLPDSIVWI